MYIEIALIIIGIFSIIYAWITSEKCPEQKIIYKMVPEHTLDLQFSKENYPSEIYLNMFNQSNPWIGGYSLGIGKTYTEEQVKELMNKNKK